MTQSVAGAADDLWETYDEEQRFAGIVYGPQRVRMAIVGLRPNQLLIVSPGIPVGEAHRQRIAQWGTPSFLLAPNHFHNVGVAWWKRSFPEAAVVAHPRAHRRLRRKVPGVAIDDLARLQPALTDEVRVFGPPMAKQGETWVSIRTSQGIAWFVTDAMLNERRLPKGPLGVVMRLLGFRAGLMNNPFFKTFFLADKAAYRAWVTAELDRDRPVLFVPAHGAPLRGPDLYGRLRALLEAV